MGLTVVKNRTGSALSPEQGSEKARSKKSTYIPYRDRLEPGRLVLVVDQIRSHHHTKPKRRGAVRALGLHGIGTTNLQPASETTFGAIRLVNNLVNVSYARWVGDGSLELVGRPVVLKELYELDPGRGVELSADGIGLVWIERGDLGSGVSWLAAAGTSPSDAIRDVHSEIGSGSLDHLPVRFHTLSGNELETDVVGLAGIDPATVVVLRVAIEDGYELVWQRSLADRESIELAVVGQLPETKDVIRAVSATCSPSVTLNRDMIAEAIYNELASQDVNRTGPS